MTWTVCRTFLQFEESLTFSSNQGQTQSPCLLRFCNSLKNWASRIIPGILCPQERKRFFWSFGRVFLCGISVHKTPSHPFLHRNAAISESRTVNLELHQWLHRTFLLGTQKRKVLATGGSNSLLWWLRWQRAAINRQICLHWGRGWSVNLYQRPSAPQWRLALLLVLAASKWAQVWALEDCQH